MFLNIIIIQTYQNNQKILVTYFFVLSNLFHGFKDTHQSRSTFTILHSKVHRKNEFEQLFNSINLINTFIHEPKVLARRFFWSTSKRITMQHERKKTSIWIVLSTRLLIWYSALNRVDLDFLNVKGKGRWKKLKFPEVKLFLFIKDALYEKCVGR